MSAVDWSERPEPWRSIGHEFSEMLPALCRDPIPPPPPRQLLVGLMAQHRRKLGLSQRELAQQIGCHQTTISEFERGIRSPSLRIRERLAAILLPEASAREAAATPR